MNPPLPAQPVTIGPAPSPRPEDAAPPADDGPAAETAERIRESLREVIDPDLGINIVDLGFIRGIQVRGRRAELRMTLTTGSARSTRCSKIRCAPPWWGAGCWTTSRWNGCSNRRGRRTKYPTKPAGNCGKSASPECKPGEPDQATERNR